MSRKLYLTLLIAMIISPLSLAQDDSADVQDDSATVQEDSGMNAQTSLDDEQSSMDEQPEGTDAPVKGVIASTKYQCELQGMTRRVEINYEVPDSIVPCSVSYYKDTEVPGEVNTLWTANNVEGYCEERAAAFVDKLRSWGWSCQDN